MRRAARAWCGAAVLLQLGTVPGRAADPPLERQGTVERLQMPAPSLGEDRRTVRVYLPPSYLTRRRYPVIYLLHGWPGSAGNWLAMGKAADTADSLIAASRIPEVILVFPNGNGTGLLGRSLYLNSYDGRSRVEDYIVRDVVAWTDANFRTQADPPHRGLIGLSDGASAALDLTFRHPDVFGACGGHSGQYRLKKGVGEGRVLGPEPGGSRLLDEHSPLLYVDRVASSLPGTTIYFDVGLADENLEDNRALHRKLAALALAHTYNEFPGSHTWGYWKTHLRDSLIALTARMDR